MPKFKDYYTVKLHDTDAAGILFFASQFKIAHDMYEKLLAQIGYPFSQRFKNNDLFGCKEVLIKATYYETKTNNCF